MILFLPGGFILGGATNPLSIVPDWVHIVANVFPLVWAYRFARDIILRGAPFMDIAHEFGGFMLYTGVLAVLVCLRFYRERKDLLAEENSAAEKRQAAPQMP